MASVSGPPKQPVSTTKAGNVVGVKPPNKNLLNPTAAETLGKLKDAFLNGGVIKDNLNSVNDGLGDLIANILTSETAGEIPTQIVGFISTKAEINGGEQIFESIKDYMNGNKEMKEVSMEISGLIAVNVVEKAIDNILGEGLGALALEVSNQSGLTALLGVAGTGVVNFFSQVPA